MEESSPHGVHGREGRSLQLVDDGQRGEVVARGAVLLGLRKQVQETLHRRGLGGDETRFFLVLQKSMKREQVMTKERAKQKQPKKRTREKNLGQKGAVVLGKILKVLTHIPVIEQRGVRDLRAYIQEIAFVARVDGRNMSKKSKEKDG